MKKNIQNLCYKKHAFSINYQNFISKIKPISLGYDIDLNLLLKNYVEFMLTNYIKNDKRSNYLEVLVLQFSLRKLVFEGSLSYPTLDKK